jgi:hypothetical protein
MSDQNQNDATNDQKTNDSDATPNPGAKGDQSEITFTDEQQKLLNKRIADARREGRAQAESDAAAAKQAAEAEAERQRQIDAGQFDTVRQSLETERDQALAKASQFDALVEAIKPEIDAQWAALPDEVKALYEGDDTDVLARQAHIARTRKLVEKLTEQNEQKRQAASFGRTPTPNGTRSKLEEGMEQGRRTGKYSA